MTPTTPLAARGRSSGRTTDVSRRPQRRPCRHRRGLVFAAIALAPLPMLACGGSADGDTIERETFIEAYTQLRTAALDTDSARIADTDRDAILARLGVTEQDLLDFVDVHGEELEYMRDVWNEIELRLDRAPERAEER